jgi:UDP-3-O-[3-hydroxymyristoyl] glucosamine N-acyltransferase
MNEIGENFEHGQVFEIGHFNVIGNNVRVGSCVKIGHHCIIEDDVTIGDSCILQGNIKIASGTIIGNGCILKHGTILTNNAILRDNVFMGPNTITLGGHANRETEHGTEIGKHCYVGAGSQIAAATKICDNVTIGALSFINKDVQIPGIYVGIPARKLP